MKICNSGIGRELSINELKKLQNHLFKMYRDIETVCKRHNLGVCLAYGNVLGALRHNGWIPWDDDLDTHMSRKDYELFLTKYAKELPPQYLVSSYHSENGSIARFTKIIDTSTIHIGIGEEPSRYSGVFIDIFPVDNVPSTLSLNRLRRLWSFFMMYTATSVMQVEQNSQQYKTLMFSTKEGRSNWRFRQIWGRLFSFVSSGTWHCWIEKYGQNKHSGMVHVMPERTACYIAVPEEMYFPFKTIDLPGIGEVNVPNRPEEYLDFVYGDWHTVPVDSDKWHHYVSKLEIPD